MTEQELIDFAVDLHDDVWRAYATDMMWFFRKGGRDMAIIPEALLPAGNLVTVPDNWVRVRHRVALKRRDRKRRVRAAAAARTAERRREYMREYMRTYRRKQESAE